MPYVCPICGLGAHHDQIKWNEHKLFNHPHFMDMKPIWQKPKQKAPDLTEPMFPETESERRRRKSPSYD